MPYSIPRRSSVPAVHKLNAAILFLTVNDNRRWWWTHDTIGVVPLQQGNMENRMHGHIRMKIQLIV